ncbi:MAG: protein TolQ [Desulfovibrionaceae bacterium]|nr:protein TolQ [Desulfovibrionaceae bacterium]PWM66667.1 MAG: protein TolQ [Desulfovibrionaceae bacterium]
MEYSVFSLFLNATLLVKLIMGLLVCLSIYSWAIIIGKWVTLHSAHGKASEGLERFENARDLRQAVQSLGGDPSSPLYAVAQQGVLEFNRSKEAGASEEVVVDNVRRALHQGVGMELGRLNRSLSVLATAANTAPFIGLFGTVWGIMNSFHAIGLMKSASLATVAPGISEALIATAIGLAVAIPATIAYNLFLGRLGGIETLLVNFAGAFLNRVQREINVQRGTPRAADSSY